MMHLFFSLRSLKKTAGAAVLAALVLLSGCGTNSSIHAGPIAIVNPNSTSSAQLQSLAIGGTAAVSMTQVSDPMNAGVDWTVTCGGNPLTGSVTGTACGSFSPVHTSEGGFALYTAPAIIPEGTTVTMIGSLTSDPSATSKATLPIAALPVSVAFVSPATSVATGASVTFTANALNDTSGAGVIFSVSCASAPCGTLSAPTLNGATYTAPSAVPQGGTVTVTATSVAYPTLSASTTLQITTVTVVTNPISVNLTPLTGYVVASGTTRSLALTALVENDPTDAGVTWTCTIGTAACNSSIFSFTSGAGKASATATFLGSTVYAKVGSTATITATSNADPGASASATIKVVASSITIQLSAAPPASMAEGATVPLTAKSTTVPESLVWTLSCGGSTASNGCGTLTASGSSGSSVTTKVTTTSGSTVTYTAPSSIPSGNTVTITVAATGTTTPFNPATATTTITPPAPTVSFVQEPPTSVSTLGQVPISASVSNDVAPGGVQWSVSCSSTVSGACGWIEPYQTADGATATYTAPPVAPTGTVSLVATSISTAFSPITGTSTPVTITPAASTISFIPSAPAQLTEYSTVNLTAAVSNDGTNAGIDWQVCGNGCGFFTVVPAIPAIAATPTTPYVPAVPAVIATTVTAWPNGLAIPYTAPIYSGPKQTVSISAAAHGNASVVTNATVAITNTLTGPAIQGSVQTGLQPVTGASVALFAAGTSGYGSASSLLYAPDGSSYGTTDSQGNFTLAGGYTCPAANSEVYLVATGGSIGSNAANPNRSLMTALGPCSNLGSTPVVVNEVTTIGSVWALAPFASNDVLSGEESALHIGASSTNTTGLANAFAAVNNLVNITTGQLRYVAPAGNAVVSYAEINTLANILYACTSTTGGTYMDGTPCGNLFEDTPNVGSGGEYSGTVASDTLQAAFNLAQHPGGGFGYNTAATSTLYSSASLTSPFQPILSTVPNDWSISLNYTGVGGLTGSSGAQFLSVDANGNLWTTQGNANRVIEWNNLGAALSPTNGYSAGNISDPGPLAIDPSGFIWISGSNGLTQLYNTGTPTLSSPFSGGTNGVNMAIDGFSNIWITNSAGILEFSNLGEELSPKGGFTNQGVSNTGMAAIDSSNNVWVGNYTTSPALFYMAELSNVGGQLIVNGATGTEDVSQTQMAADGKGEIWFPTSFPELCKMPAYGGVGTVGYEAQCILGGTSSASVIRSIGAPQGIAVDGAGTVWIGNAGSSIFQPNLTEVVPAQISSNSSANYAGFVSSSLGAGPLQVAVDSSGNVWVLLTNNTITEYVGIATPAVTPIALAVQNKKLGAEP